MCLRLYFCANVSYIFCICLLTEATTTANNEKPSEQRLPSDHTNDTAAVLILPENGAAVKFVSDGDIGNVDGASTSNGPADVPSTSVDAVVKTAKTDKEEKAKKEKPKTVGYGELVTFLCLYLFFKLCIEDVNENNCAAFYKISTDSVLARFLFYHIRYDF